MAQFVLTAFGDEISPSPEVQIEVLRRHGIGCLELRSADGVNIADFTPAMAASLAHRLEAGGIRVSALGSPIGKIGVNDDFAPHLAQFERLLGFAELFGTRFIRVFSFYIPKGVDPARCRGEVLRRLYILADRAAARGVTLLHENEKGIYGDTAERCLDLLRAVGSPYLRATFDPANFIQCGVTPYPDAYRLLSGYIEYVHIKDALAATGQVVPAGCGDGRLPALLQTLSEKGFSGYLSIEPHLGYFPGMEKLERKLDVTKIKNGGPEAFGVAADALASLLASLPSGGRNA